MAVIPEGVPQNAPQGGIPNIHVAQKIHGTVVATRAATADAIPGTPAEQTATQDKKNQKMQSGQLLSKATHFVQAAQELISSWLFKTKNLIIQNQIMTKQSSGADNNSSSANTPLNTNNNTTSNNSNAKSNEVNASNNGVSSSNSSAATAKSSAGQKEKSLEDLFEANLKDIYSAEQQLISALPEVAKAAYSEDLRDAFNKHLEQTRRHAERLEKIFQRLRINKGGEKCAAMEGLIKEGKKVLEDFEEGPVRDSALIIGAQKIEHYEIAAYGSLCELADVLGFTKIGDVLDRTLEEEENTDRTLTRIAMNVNDEAYDSIHNEEKPGAEE